MAVETMPTHAHRKLASPTRTDTVALEKLHKWLESELNVVQKVSHRPRVDRFKPYRIGARDSLPGEGAGIAPPV